jgi:undecaprenyl-diphosphatase
MILAGANAMLIPTECKLRDGTPMKWIKFIVNRLLVWLGGHELAVLLAFAGIACGFWLFVFIAGEVTEGKTKNIDETLLLAMRNPDRTPIGSLAMQDAARDVTALGGATFLTLLTIATGGFLLLDGKKHLGLFLYGAVGSGLLFNLLLKEFFHRPRPDIVPHAAYASSTSFPSGHSMLSAVTYLTLGALLARSQRRKRLKAYFLLLAILITLLVGISRVYLGVHWPTDVLAGWVAGASWAICCWLVVGKLQKRHALEEE